MKSRSGLWILSICLVSLAGCTNMQNRLGNRTSGNAASLSAAAPASGPLLGSPVSSFGEPPPPMPPPPSDPGATLGPIGDPSPQKLDLSLAPSASAAPSDSAAAGRRPQNMYNLGAPESSSAKVADNAPRKSSAISKLASKASPAKALDELPKAKTSAVARLSADAKGSSNEKTAPVEKATPDKSEAPSPAPAPAPAVEAKAEASAEIMDTTLLAQPVRKGSAGKDDKESKGPQSNVLPGVKLFNNMNKPTIYPVSNPVSKEPVSLIKFS